MRFKVKTTKVLADTVTPVTIFLRVRKKYSEALLLESADYRGSENSLSFICCAPIARFQVKEGRQEILRPGNDRPVAQAAAAEEVLPNLVSFVSELDLEQSEPLPNGFFGYCTYDAVNYFEDIKIAADRDPERVIPDIRYAFYEFVIIINHFKNEMYLVHNQAADSSTSGTLDELRELIFKEHFDTFEFKAIGQEESNLSDEEHLSIISSCKEHIARGDVFQIVPSRRFSQAFEGDDFNVYRSLRSINPSPYLFYFDFGDYRLFGSSPEAQILVNDKTASIYPIAGTYPRRADRSNDTELAENLKQDPKENAEHVMLVDLARNDLSKHCRSVEVASFKEVQFYSHVIHLVSKVRGELQPGACSVSILADTFPAGTLSGAPKYRAMQLIDKYEQGNRGIYGGCIGFIAASGDITHAIVIRSFLSKDNKLFYQAGGGVVFDSNSASEVQEVKNKLGALKQAIIQAEALC